MRLLFDVRTIAWLMWSANCWAAGGFEWIGPTAGRLELRQDGRTVFVYHHGDGRDCCFLHPVVTPAGVRLTDSGPADHVHHRGVFWAWPQVSSGGQTGDLWLGKGAIHRLERIAEFKAGPRSAHLRAVHSWLLQGKPVVRETLFIHVHPAEARSQSFDVTLTLEALSTPVEIAGAADRGKGYGGFSARFAPRQDTAILSSDGPVVADEDHVAHQWAQLEGTFLAGRAGLRITSDPGNPAFPNEWCLRNYGFVGATFPGLKGFRLEPKTPLTLRYQVMVFDSEARK